MKKRLFILLLAVVTLFAVLPLTGASVAENAPAVTVGSVQGAAGSTVTVPISLSGNPGIAAFRFKLHYDSNLLELVAVEFPKLLSSPAAGGSLNANPYIISWFSATASSEEANGVFARLTFRIKADAKAGSTAVSISYDQTDLCDSNFRDVVLATVSGTVGIGCQHVWDVFNIQCEKCGERQMQGYMQQRIDGDTKDFRLLIETFDATFENADSVTLTMDFLDANRKPVREKPIKAALTTVFKEGVYAGGTLYKPTTEGYCIGGVVVTGIPVAVGVQYVTASVTFVKGDTSITYELGTASIG